MTVPVPARRRSLWIVAPFALIVAVAALWSGFWLYASRSAEAAIAAWRAEEARLGRTYACGSQTIGGYPFRIEVRCADASAELRDGTPLLVRVKGVLVVAQVYQPRLLIAEIAGPATVEEPGRPPAFAADWRLAQMSLRGDPTDPERLSLVAEGLTVDRPAMSGTEPLFAAARLELHGRVDPGSMPGNPILDVAARVSAGAAPALGAAGASPTNAEIDTVLRGLSGTPFMPLPALMRQLQAAGGRLEIRSARLQQLETTALATGTLGLSQSGRLDGTLRLTVAGLEPFLTRSSLDRMLQPPAADRGMPGGLNSLAPVLGNLDRLLPGLGQVARSSANASTVAAGLSLIGSRTELDGKPAIALPLRFTDGAAALGPVPLGRIAPLF